MSQQFSLRGFNLCNAPEIECRNIISSITVAHVVGLPAQSGEAKMAIGWQKIPDKIRRFFGEIPYAIIEPELKRHPKGCLQFPKIEHIAFLLSSDMTQGLAVIWYEDELEPVLSEENLKRIACLDWKSLAGPTTYHLTPSTPP